MYNHVIEVMLGGKALQLKRQLLKCFQYDKRNLFITPKNKYLAQRQRERLKKKMSGKMLITAQATW